MQKETVTTLKPCPFCGYGGNRLNICAFDYSDEGKRYAVNCRTKNCHGGIWSLANGLFKTEKQAIKEWNRRDVK